MDTLAFDGPGPWILFFPLIWAAVVVTVVSVLRRTVGRSLPWAAGRPSSGGHGSPGEAGPIAVLGRRFASGEIDEDEYWRRLSVLDEQFGPAAEEARGRRR